MHVTFIYEGESHKGETRLDVREMLYATAWQKYIYFLLFISMHNLAFSFFVHNFCLSNYSRLSMFKFEFNAKVKKWDTIQIEDLKIDNNEVLVVNCKFKLRHLLE